MDRPLIFASILVVDDAYRVPLIRDPNKATRANPKVFWRLPGGKSEPEEQLGLVDIQKNHNRDSFNAMCSEVAKGVAIRELKEETGIKLPDGTALEEVFFRHNEDRPREEFTSIVFLARVRLMPAHNLFPNKEGEETQIWSVGKILISPDFHPAHLEKVEGTLRKLLEEPPPPPATR